MGRGRGGMEGKCTFLCLTLFWRTREESPTMTDGAGRDNLIDYKQTSFYIVWQRGRQKQHRNWQISHAYIPQPS